MKNRTLLAILCALCTLGIASAQSTGTTVAKTLGQSATLSWVAPTTYVTGAPIASGTTITYSVYEAQQAVGTGCAAPTFGAAVVTGLTTTSYVTPTYTAVGVYCYEITDTVASVESAPSNIVSADVSAPVPNAPAATIQ